MNIDCEDSWEEATTIDGAPCDLNALSKADIQGKQLKLVAVNADDEEENAITFKSSNTKYVKIGSTTGTLTIVKKGRVKITTTATDGSKSKAYVYIKVVD